MKIAELSPLIRKIEPLRAIEDARDIYEEVSSLAEDAETASMGQSVCSHVIAMCHPKAWGDRYVAEAALGPWTRYLSELSEVANSCGQAIYEARARNGAGNG